MILYLFEYGYILASWFLCTFIIKGVDSWATAQMKLGERELKHPDVEGAGCQAERSLHPP